MGTNDTVHPMRRALLCIAPVLIALLIFACGAPSSPAASTDIDRPFARAATAHMLLAVRAATNACTNAVRGMPNVDADALLNVCSKRLVNAADACDAAIAVIDPWQTEGAAKVGCAGKVVALALAGLRADFEKRKIVVPVLMRDGEQLGGWASQWALPSCDVRSPTTTVTVTVPDLPPEPPIPTWQSF